MSFLSQQWQILWLRTSVTHSPWFNHRCWINVINHQTHTPTHSHIYTEEECMWGISPTHITPRQYNWCSHWPLIRRGLALYWMCFWFWTLDKYRFVRLCAHVTADVFDCVNWEERFNSVICFSALCTERMEPSVTVEEVRTVPHQSSSNSKGDRYCQSCSMWGVWWRVMIPRSY